MSTQATKDRLLDTAEQLFARHGFEATSVRMITSGAEANQAAINYHFGSKEELIKAVIARRAIPINRERLELLAQYEQEAGDQPPSLEKIFHAFAAPMLKICLSDDGGRHVIKLIGIAHSLDVEKTHEIMFDIFGDVSHRFYQVLLKHNLGLTIEEFHCRLGFMFGSIMGSMKVLTLQEFMNEQGSPQISYETLTGYLLTFLIGGFTTMPTPEQGGIS